MANIYPSVRPGPSEKVSIAELDVLDALSALPDKWHVLHSLWLKTHKRKLHAEADFIVISDRAVILLEVKGGEIWRDDQGWHFRTKSGRHVDVKKEGPFDQARGAYHAVQTHLIECGHPELFNELVWGYGVICPDCILNIPQNDPFIDPEMLLDGRGFPSELARYIDQLTTYWSERHATSPGGTRSGRTRSASIGPARSQELLGLLRPSFELVVGLGVESTLVERQLLRLTENQLMALDLMALEPRNLLMGAAGTGKTILLVEQAKRMCAVGKKVLVLCFNKHLATKIRYALKSEPNVEVASYHQFAVRLCSRAGFAVTFAESWEDFCISLRASAELLVSSLTQSDLFDYVLIDEGQDLMNQEFMALVDCVISGGINNGEWMIACDSRQAIFLKNFDEKMFERLGAVSRKSALSLNCRNTRQIAAYVAGFSGEGSRSTRGADGETPGFRYFEAREDYLRILKKVVNELIQSFSSAGIDASEIIILYANSEYVPVDIMRPGFFLRRACEFDPDAPPGDYIQVSSVQAFKGLEARGVILLGVDEFSTDLSRGLFYVGASRAKTNLRVILPVNCDYAKTVVPLISEFLRG